MLPELMPRDQKEAVRLVLGSHAQAGDRPADRREDAAD
jgi:hypothetical protein